MENGKKLEFPRRAGGGQGEPGVPSTLLSLLFRKQYNDNTIQTIPNMKVILDEREASLFEKCTALMTESYKDIQILKQVIPLGDIIIRSDDDVDIVIIERKSLQDLLASIKDGRYEEQSYRLRHSTNMHMHNIIYVVEGSLAQLRTPQEKKIVYSSIASLNIFKGFSVLRTASMQETAELVMAIADKTDRSFKNGKTVFYSNESQGEQPQVEKQGADYCSVVKKVKKDNITPENIGEIILCQLPGISSTSAIAIMQKFTSFFNLIESVKADPKCLDNITTCDAKGKMRKISKTTIQNISLYLTGNPLREPNY